MRSYAKVPPQFWQGKVAKRLRRHPDAQRLALYLRTCPAANMLGLYCLPAEMMALDLGVSLDTVEAALSTLSELGLAHYDDEAEVVWVPGEACVQVAPSLSPRDKQAAGLSNVFASIPVCSFIESVYNDYCDTLHLKPHPSMARRSPLEAPSMPPRSQDQDQDQEQNQDHHQDHDASTGFDDVGCVDDPGCGDGFDDWIDFDFEKLIAASPAGWGAPSKAIRRTVTRLAPPMGVWTQAVEITQARGPKHPWRYACTVAAQRMRDGTNTQAKVTKLNRPDTPQQAHERRRKQVAEVLAEFGYTLDTARIDALSTYELSEDDVDVLRAGMGDWGRYDWELSQRGGSPADVLAAIG